MSFIKFFSVSTWQKIGFVRNKDKLKMHETTVTQNLLFQFQILADQYPQSVQMFESTDEKARGNDIELFIKTNGGYVAFPCQAKISYKQANKGGKKFKPEPYTAINHPVEISKGVKQQQVKSLINYANKLGGIPIYLFYNYCADKPTINSIAKATGTEIELFGCSFVNAEQLSNAYLLGMKWKPIPNFSLIHPSKAQPFFRLFELIGKSRFTDYKTKNATLGNKESDEIFGRLRQYSPDELVANDNWVKTTISNEYSVISSSNQSAINEDYNGKFNPSFRIVFTNKDFEGFTGQMLMMM